jgi:hypothetical protein
MNTNVLWGQVLFSLPAVVASALTPACVAPLSLGAILAAWWLLLNANYAASLGIARRSKVRTSGDHQVGIQSALLAAAGILGGLFGVVNHDVRLTDSVALAVCFSALGAIGFVVFASSLVDWYYVRPRLDGVVREPPCRSSREQIWMSVTRFWYQHRSIAELLGITGIAVAFTASVAALLVHGRSDIEVLVTVAGVPLGLLGSQWSGAIRTLRRYGVDPPRQWLGDLLEGQDGAAYLLHVTVRGPVVRDWDPKEGRWQELRDLPFDEIDARRLHPTRFRGCDECSLINPHCEWAVTERSGGKRQRLVF